MGEHLLLESDAKDGQELDATTTKNELGRITVLEALAEETTAISADARGRTTMQGDVDFDD